MTIKLFDIEAQAQFRQEVETYDLRSKARMEDPTIGGDWPQYPVAPKPMVDSADPGFAQHRALPMSLSSTGMTPDLQPQSLIPFDGNSQSEVKGFDSTWSDGGSSTPFKITKR